MEIYSLIQLSNTVVAKTLTSKLKSQNVCLLTICVCLLPLFETRRYKQRDPMSRTWTKKCTEGQNSENKAGGLAPSSGEDYITDDQEITGIQEDDPLDMLEIQVIERTKVKDIFILQIKLKL